MPRARSWSRRARLRLPWREPVPRARCSSRSSPSHHRRAVVADLRQPSRFLWTLTRPQWRSAHARSYVIAAYGSPHGARRLGLARRPVPPVLVGAPRSSPRAPHLHGLRSAGEGPRPWKSALWSQSPRAGLTRGPPCSRVVLLVPAADERLLVAGEYGRHAPKTRGWRRGSSRTTGDHDGVLVLGHLLLSDPRSRRPGAVASALAPSASSLGALYVQRRSGSRWHDHQRLPKARLQSTSSDSGRLARVRRARLAAAVERAT